MKCQSKAVQARRTHNSTWDKVGFRMVEFAMGTVCKVKVILSLSRILISVEIFFSSADYNCCSTNFNHFHHDSVNLSKGRSVDSRDNLSFSQKLHLMKSGRFQLFKGGRVENQDRKSVV